MGFVYLNIEGLGLRLDRSSSRYSRYKRFDWVLLDSADVFDSKHPYESLFELAFTPRRRVLREIASIERVEHKLVLVDREKETSNPSDEEYYRKGLSDAFNLICDGLNVDSEHYDRDQSDVECILDAVKDASEMLKSFGVKFDKEAWDFVSTGLTIAQLTEYVTNIKSDLNNAVDNGYFDSAEGLERALEVLKEMCPLALESVINSKTKLDGG